MAAAVASDAALACAAVRRAAASTAALLAASEASLAAAVAATFAADRSEAALSCAAFRAVAASVAAKVKTFIYLSTAHVYGHPLSGSITETTTPNNQHPYATSHLAGEKALLFASGGGEIDGIVLRLSNIYGVPTHKNVDCWMLLVNDLCKQVVTTQRLVLRSSGAQRRNFLTMNDAFSNERGDTNASCCLRGLYIYMFSF